MKRAYQQQFEFLEQNKRNGYVEGKHGKRLPDRAAEAAHAKGCLVAAAQDGRAHIWTNWMMCQSECHISASFYRYRWVTSTTGWASRVLAHVVHRAAGGELRAGSTAGGCRRVSPPTLFVVVNIQIPPDVLEKTLTAV